MEIDLRARAEVYPPPRRRPLEAAKPIDY